MNSPAEIPTKVRSQLADSIEDMGNAMSLLRESIDDAESGNIEGSKMCASDALELINILQARFENMGFDLSKWS
jgi:hypothetical protein